MTVPDQHAAGYPQTPDAPTAPLLRAAIWVAIGALIASAIVCVVWVLVGDQTDIVGKAFLTILLLVAFAGVTILDAHLAPRRPAWFALASMGTWIAALLIGAVMIWMPERVAWSGFTRFVQFLFIVLVLQLALLHVRLYIKALQRYETRFTRIVGAITIVLVVALAVLLILPLMLSEYLWFPGIYWRVVVAVAILAAVGTAIIPLVNVLFAPKKPRAAFSPTYGALPTSPPQPQIAAAPAAPQQELLPWPNYVDGITPLPMLPDGSPDWNAYYTGHPSPGAHVFGPPTHAAHHPAQPVAPHHAPGYEGYPPPPPLPPRP